jgi:hypothetical protein
MSGITIIATLLPAYEPLTSAVPAGSIKAGRLPDAPQLPTLLLRSVSRTEVQRLKRGATVRVRERIAVTVRASAYRETGALLRLVRGACAGKTGTIAGFTGVAVLADGSGGDLDGPADTFERTQDLLVTFDEPA